VGAAQGLDPHPLFDVRPLCRPVRGRRRLRRGPAHPLSAGGLASGPRPSPPVRQRLVPGTSPGGGRRRDRAPAGLCHWRG
jgi:hypothetical protein